MTDTTTEVDPGADDDTSTSASDDTCADDDTEAGDGSDAADDHDDTDETGEPKKVGIRQRLKDAEAERDALSYMLDQARQRVFSDELARVNLSNEVAAAAGLTVDSVLDDEGQIDLASLRERAEQVRLQHGIPRKPKPDPLLGRAGAPVKETTWGEVLRG